MAINLINPPKKYIITQLKETINGVDQLLQLHPRTDSDIVLYNGIIYTGDNVKAILDSEVINTTAGDQAKVGGLTIQGLLSADGNLDIGANLSIESDTSNIVFTKNNSRTVTLNAATSLGGDVTFVLPDMFAHPLYAANNGVYTLATTDDVPPIKVQDGLFDLTYIDDKTAGNEFGKFFVEPFESKQTDTIAFDTGTDAPSYTGRLNLNANLYTTNLNVTTDIQTSTLSAGSTIQATGLASLNGGIEVLTNKFTVNTSGDTAIAGTLGVTGITTVTGLSNLNGGIAVATDKFEVLATGATTIGSTLDVTGIATFNEDLLVGPIVGSPGTFQEKFSVDVTTGDVSTEGSIEVKGDLTIHGEDILFDSLEFNINHDYADSEDPVTTILNIDSAAIISGSNRTINIGTNGLSGSDTTINIGSQAEAVEHSIINLFGTVNVVGGVGSVITTDELNVVDNQIILNSNLTEEDEPFVGQSGIIINRGDQPQAKFEWDEVLDKWTATGGLVGEGNSYIEGTFFSTGDLWVGGTTLSASKFNVKADTGDTVIEGTLTTNGLANLDAGIAVDGSKFTVADGSGNTYIDGTLEVKQGATFNGGISGDEGTWSIADITGNIYTEGTLTVDGQTTLTNTLLITDKATPTPTTLFSVSGTNGNTAISGTLNLTGAALFNSSVTMRGSATEGEESFVINNGESTPTITFRVDSATGDVSFAGDLAVNSNKFIVDSATGNTTIAGTLLTTGISNLNGGIAVATDKFEVLSTGATTINSTLDVTGDVTGGTFNGLTIENTTGTLDVDNGSELTVLSNVTLGDNTDNEPLSIFNGTGVGQTFKIGSQADTLNKVAYYGSEGLTSEAQLALVRGGTGVDNTQIASEDGQGKIFVGPSSGTGNATFRTLINDDLPDSGVEADTYSAVQVNSKGIITGGNNIIEIGDSSNMNAPSPILATNGLFFYDLTPNPA